MLYLMAFLGGMVGAPLRYLTDRAVQARHDSVFPWGTFTVNVVGSFVLGALTGLAVRHGVPSDVTVLVGTGACGGLTTFSTFSFETVRLLEDGSLAEAGLNVAGSLLVGVGAAVVAFVLFSHI